MHYIISIVSQKHQWMNSITHVVASDHKRIGEGKVYEVFLGNKQQTTKLKFVFIVKAVGSFSVGSFFYIPCPKG